MCATWDEMEGSDSEEDLDSEEAMVCFMAIEESKNDDFENDVNDHDLYYDDLSSAFEERHDNMQKLLKRLVA